MSIYLPHKSQGVTVGHPASKPYGNDTSRIVCDEFPTVAYRDGKWGDYFVADSHFRIHDCTGGVYALYTFDRDLISIHKGFNADFDAFAHAVVLMNDRSQL
jgi:hypothetical protein